MSSALPSLHALRAFEAAARLGAFNRAAAELNVSPTAISHHIRTLETDMGTALFVRAARGISLTEAGEKLARSCIDAFGVLDKAVAAARTSSDRLIVSVAFGPILAARWLSPLLSDFWSAFPDVDLRLVHTPTRIDPTKIEADIVSAWGEGN